MRRRPVRRIVTPELVAVRLEPAGLGRRFLATLIDGVLVVSLAGLFDTVARVVFPSVGVAIGITIRFVFGVGYPIAFELLREGRTPGKSALGLRVVDGRGRPIGFEQSVVRNLARALDLAPIFYGLGGTYALFDREGRRLGDLLADTLVVRDDSREVAKRSALGAITSAVELDPDVARRARRVVGVAEREFLTALLLRSDRLDPRARYDLMTQVATHYRAVLAVDLPHLSGEAFTRALAAAVLGARR